MKNRIIKLLFAGIACCLLVWILMISVQAMQLRRIKRYAENVMEPFYTLVIDGKIIEHTHMVHFDRYCVSTAGVREGYDDGRIEIPLLIVLDAIGAEYCEEESGTILIEYDNQEYLFIPAKQAIYPKGTNLSDTLSENNSQKWYERNLLLIWPEKKNGYFREDQGEYIVDLASLQKLASLWNFTFDFDSERGIVFVYSKA